MRIFSGLGGKLLLAFSLMALLTLSASLLGWVGLSHLRQLEQGVQQTLADQELARTLSRLSGEIQSASRLLATATSEQEREHQGRLLTLQGQQLQQVLAQLGRGQGSTSLDQLSQSIIGNLGQQGWLVGERLTLMAQGEAQRARLVAAAGQIALEGHEGVEQAVKDRRAAGVRQQFGLVADQRTGGDQQLDAARTTFRQLVPLIQALFAEPNPAPVKALLAHQGLIEPHLRAPMQDCSAATAVHLQNLLADLP